MAPVSTTAPGHATGLLLHEPSTIDLLQSLVDLIGAHPALATDLDGITRIRLQISEPAYSIIADPAKRTPPTQ